MPRTIRRFAVLVLLLWLAYTAIVNLAVPQLEVVGRAPALLISRLVSWVDDLWCRAIGAGV
ncbi:hypothetical protein [Mycobacterium liflandii]|uniref:hypothetical protein n=1 Tax=Mycobacterium liflandii TaxID=261524 RepID=UPI00130D5AC4|nr:hypothetical protein [Mycobacterium liflandii]